MKKPRPTWTLGEDKLPAAYPARELDPEQALSVTLGRKKSSMRMNDVSDFVRHAVNYAVQVSQDALVDLALLAADRNVRPYKGWGVRFLSKPAPNRVEFLLEKPGEPGAWHVLTGTSPRMTDAAAAEMARLNKQVAQELNALGVKGVQRVMRALRRCDDQTPGELALAKLEQSPDSYRAMCLGDRLDKFCVTALNIKGAPRGVKESSLPEDVIGKGASDCDWDGKHIDARPEADFLREEENMISAWTGGSCGASAEQVFPIISGLLSTNGLSRKVARKNEEVATQCWRAYGTEAAAEIMDAAHAAVCRSNGLFDERVHDQVERFSRGIAAHDVERRLDEFVFLAKGLVEHGHTGPEHEFKANDMRDNAHCKSTDRGFSIWARTENGLFRADLELGGSGDVLRLDAFLVSKGKEYPIGRFLAENGTLAEDYDGSHTGGAPIEYTIGYVRNMNGLISSLSSLSCVLEMECPSSNEDTHPSP